MSNDYMNNKNIFVRLVDGVYNLLPFENLKKKLDTKINNNYDVIKKTLIISGYTYPLYIIIMIAINLNFLYEDKVPEYTDLHTESDYKAAIEAYSNEFYILHDDSIEAQYRKIAIKDTPVKHRQDPQGKAEFVSYGRTNAGIYKNLATNTYRYNGEMYTQIMNIPDYLFWVCYDNYATNEKPYELMFKCMETVSVSINQVREGLIAKGKSLEITDTIFIYGDSLEVYKEEETIILTKGIDYENQPDN